MEHMSSGTAVSYGQGSVCTIWTVFVNTLQQSGVVKEKWTTLSCEIKCMHYKKSKEITGRFVVNFDLPGPKFYSRCEVVWIDSVRCNTKDGPVSRWRIHSSVRRFI